MEFAISIESTPTPIFTGDLGESGGRLATRKVRAMLGAYLIQNIVRPVSDVSAVRGNLTPNLKALWEVSGEVGRRHLWSLAHPPLARADCGFPQCAYLTPLPHETDHCIHELMELNKSFDLGNTFLVPVRVLMLALPEIREFIPDDSHNECALIQVG